MTDTVLILVSPYSGRLWSNVMEGLSEFCDARVIDCGDASTITEMTDHILSQAPSRFVFAGFCMGGHIGFDICHRYPERLLGLILINTSPATDTESQKLMRDQRIKSIKARATFMPYPDAVYTEYASRWLLSPCNTPSVRLLSDVRSLLEEVPLMRSYAYQKAMSTRADGCSILSGSNIPTLVIGGREDRICAPETWPASTKQNVNVSVQILEHCGHIAPFEQPKALVRCVTEWMAKFNLTKKQRSFAWKQ